MKKIITFTFLIFLAEFKICYCQSFQWALNANSDISSNGNGIDYDASGNCYVTGSFKKTINFGPYYLYVTTGLDDIYLAKFDPNGIPQWAVKAGGFGDDQGVNIATDALGNSYITGYFEGTATFGTNTITAVGNFDIFVAKYNSSGVAQWVKQAGDTAHDKGADIDIDKFGNCYVTGTFNKTAFFNGNPIVSNGMTDVFLAKYDTFGNFQWVTSGGGTSIDIVKGISLDPYGNIFISGQFYGSSTYGSVNINSISDDAYIIKFNSAGTPIWGVTAGGSGQTKSNGISTDALGNCYISGFYTSVTNFGGITINPTGFTNNFIAKYNSSGNIFWVKAAINNIFNVAFGLSTDPSGNSYFSGYHSSPSTFGSIVLTPTLAVEFYMIKYDNLGNEVYAKKAIFQNQRHNDISVDAAGNVYIAGTYEGWFGTATFDSHVIYNTNNSYETFVTKIDAASNLISGNVFIDYNNNNIKESNDLDYPNAILSLTPGNIFTTSNNIGDYYFSTGIGTFNTNIYSVPTYYTANPVSHTSSFSTLNLKSMNNDFALYPSSSVNDLKITITNNYAAVINKNSKLYVTVKNVGTNIQSGSAILTYDNTFVYVPAMTSPLPDNISSNNLTWNFTNLKPLESITFIAGVHTPLSTTLGTTLTSTGVVNPVSGDANPLNNYYTLKQIVDETFEPNEKSVQSPNFLTPQNIANGDPLTFTIRFQNTGTATVNNVVVTDVLSPKLNVTTFEMIDASHSYTYIIKNTGTVEWTFSNILLPDKFADEPNSHGFIKYSVKAKNTVIPGDTIENQATIYFNNFIPVLTNTTKTPVINPPKIFTMSWNLQAMFPTPTNILVYLRSSSPPYSILDSSLNINLSITPSGYRANFEYFNISNNVPFYVVAKHRNSIETWSSEIVYFDSSVSQYDFTSSINSAYGNNMILVGGIPSFYSGDVNQDGVIDVSDISQIDNDAYNFLSGNDLPSDLNGDNLVDITDLFIADNNVFNIVAVVRP